MTAATTEIQEKPRKMRGRRTATGATEASGVAAVDEIAGLSLAQRISRMIHEVQRPATAAHADIVEAVKPLLLRYRILPGHEVVEEKCQIYDKHFLSRPELHQSAYETVVRITYVLESLDRPDDRRAYPWTGRAVSDDGFDMGAAYTNAQRTFWKHLLMIPSPPGEEGQTEAAPPPSSVSASPAAPMSPVPSADAAAIPERKRAESSRAPAAPEPETPAAKPASPAPASDATQEAELVAAGSEGILPGPDDAAEPSVERLFEVNKSLPQPIFSSLAALKVKAINGEEGLKGVQDQILRAHAEQCGPDCEPPSLLVSTATS